jgi:hypothetical protein
MAYTVIPLETDEHRDTLRTMWKENSYDPRTNVCARERFEWLYRDSGAGDVQSWLAVERERQAVIGCGSVFRSNRYFRGRVVQAGVPAVFFVHKEHRLAAAALAIQRAVLAGGRQSGFEVFVAKPNRQARLICDRIGYQPVSDLQDWVRVVWDDDALSVNPGPIDAPDELDEIVSAADHRFDDLWNRAKDRYPMAADKTAAFLNWRYSGFKENYRFYCLFSRDDRRLLGYVVFYAMEDGVVISQLLCEEPSGPLLRSLLLGFCSRMKTDGYVWVSLWYAGMPSFEEALEEAGFNRGTHHRTLLVYVSPDADAAFRTAMLDRNNWFIFAAEMDVLLSDEVWADGSDQPDHRGSADAVASES